MWELWQNHRNGLNDENWTDLKVHKKSFSALRSSPQCSLCEQILVELEHEITYWGHQVSDFEDAPITMSRGIVGTAYGSFTILFNYKILLGYFSLKFYCDASPAHSNSLIPEASFDICVSAGKQTSSRTLLLQPIEISSPLFCELCSCSSVLPGSSFRSSIPGRLVKPHADPESLLATARKWLKECDSIGCRVDHDCGHQSDCQNCDPQNVFHSMCRRPVGVLPSRILDIGPPLKSQFIRLIDQTSDIVAPYIALSHCWGPNQSFTTTAENLMERKEGIDISRMPRSFQDAVLVTRLIGVRYLWIDSLCILQGNGEDWLRESAQMGLVYQNAYLVIGAARAAADTEGFLQPRTPPRFTIAIYKRLPVLPLPRLIRNFFTNRPLIRQAQIFLVPHALLETPMQMYLTRSRFQSVPSGDLDRPAPLSTRGWTLQERHLARRTLFFGKEQMFWECQSLVADEYGRRVPRESDNLLALAKKSRSITLQGSGTLNQTAHLRPHVLGHTWNRVVANFLRMDLTIENDRLPAISGLAAAMGEITGDEYLAGIWLSDLHIGLLWCREARPVVKPWTTYIEITKLIRPKLYRAPSWSWAAIEGSIIFPTKTYDSNKILFSYVAHRIDTEGESPYGPVTKGYLKLQGFVFPVTKHIRLPTEAFQQYWSVVDDEGNLDFKIGYEQLIEVTINDLKCNIAATFEVLSEDRKNLSIFFMIQNTDYTIDPAYAGLIIQETGETPKSYRRVGIVYGVLMHVSDMSNAPATYSSEDLPSIYAELGYRRSPKYVPTVPCSETCTEATDVPNGIHLVTPDLGNCEKAIVTLI